jgi:hypothetical protein
LDEVVLLDDGHKTPSSGRAGRYDFIPMQTVPTLPLIPTRYKSKIAHTHSYPIGAEAISLALAGVPQFERLELTFWDYKFQPLAKSYEVLKVEYLMRGSFHSASKEMVARGDLNARWSIVIKPVPRGQRHAVQNDLLERRFPFVKQWLIENTSAGRIGRTTMTYFWYEDEQKLGYEESQKVEPERIKTSSSRA